jgi:hypothetical protein
MPSRLAAWSSVCSSARIAGGTPTPRIMLAIALFVATVTASALTAFSRYGPGQAIAACSASAPEPQGALL